MACKAVIADDEPLLRAQLRSRLERLWPELEVVHEMATGRDVDQVLDAHAPDLFFLDIHMPGVNGLEAARRIGARAHIVFVTAFDQYAVEAFERGAIDYVLKPFNEERLATTVARLRERIGAVPPSLDSLVVPITATIIIDLFATQKLGTGAVGRMFGPIMIAWFTTIAILGIHGITLHPEVHKALSPSYAFDFLFQSREPVGQV